MIEDEGFIKWVMAGIGASVVTVSVWAGTLEQRIRGKAGREECARKPVERDTLEELINGMNGKLDSIQDSSTSTTWKLEKLDTKLQTVSEDVAVLKATVK